MTSSSRALAALSLCVLLASLGSSIANVALPTLARAFGAPVPHVQWIVLAYLLAITTTVVSVGRLADLAGRRRLLLAGIALFTAASVACGLSPTLAALIAARAVQGIGAAAMMALAMPFVAEVVPKEKAGRAMGLLGTTSAAGTALGPSLGGVLIAELGWRALFLAPVTLALAAALLASRSLPADSVVREERPRFDAAGTVVLGLALGAYAFGMTASYPSLLVAAMGGVFVFVRVEATAMSPLVRLDLLSDRARAAGLAANALVTTVVMATLVVGPFYLAGALGLDAAVVGVVLSAGPVVAALTGFPAGALVDRFGTGRMAVAGLATSTAGSALLSLTSPRWGVGGWIVPLVLVTTGYALFQAANGTAMMDGVAVRDRGVVSGMLNLSRNLGLITGASLMGAVFANANGVTSGVHATFGVAIALVLTALAVTLAAARAAVSETFSRDLPPIEHAARLHSRSEWRETPHRP